MAHKNIKWFKIADNTNMLTWQKNSLAVVEVGGKKITLAKSGSEIFACSFKCPHAGGVLADGFVDPEKNIVCPLHRYKFSLETGRNVSGEGYFLKMFAVEERPEGIFVGFEENKWLSFFK